MQNGHSDHSTDDTPSTPIMTPSISLFGGEDELVENAQDNPNGPLIFVNNVSVPIVHGLRSTSPRNRRSPSPFQQTIQFQIGSKRGSQQFTFKQLYNTTPDRHGRESLSETSSPISEDTEPDDSLSPAMNIMSLKSSGASGSSRYRADDEVLPSEPYYNKGFQISLREGVDIAKAVVQCLQNSNEAHRKDSGLATILQSARALSNFESPATRTIGIVGDSAAGKSSLINSLLDKTDLAHTGDQGSAVTSFVTEYKYKSAGQESDFIVEAEYLKLEEINENLEELLYSYRLPYAPNLKDDLSGEEFKTLETESQVAWDTLYAAFGDQSDFSVARLRDFSDGASDLILRDLRIWASHMSWPSGAEGGIWREAADTVEECYSLTEKFMQDRLWPFTKIMRVYLEAPVLKTGLVLADLPGYRDINFARVKAAKQYQASCDELFIVAPINRAVTDESIKAIITDYLGSGAKTAGQTTHPNITVVCTHAADIDAKKAEKSYKGIKVENLNHAKRQVEKTKNQVYKLHERARTNYKYLFVAARNSDISRKLQRTYAEQFHPLTLPIFCVDNKDYQDSEFSLDIASTGIPQLRHFCYSVPARALFRSAHNFLKILLPSLVQSLQLWYQTNGPQSRSKPIPELIDIETLRTELDELVYEWEAEFLVHAHKQILKPLKKKAWSFNDAAVRASRPWEGWHWASYKTYCGHNGNYSTAAQPHRNWNAELLEGMNMKLSLAWFTLDADVTTDLPGWGRAMQSILEEVIKTSIDNEAPAAFIQNMKSRQRDIEHFVEDETVLFLREFRAIKRNSTGSHEHSYIMAQMRPVYKKCYQDGGRGTFARCKNWMHDKISSGTIFPAIRKATLKAMEASSLETVTHLKSHLNGIADAIENDLKTMTRPLQSVFGEEPGLETKMSELLKRAELEMKEIVKMGEDATKEAETRGYIRSEEGQAREKTELTLVRVADAEKTS